MARCQWQETPARAHHEDFYRQNLVKACTNLRCLVFLPRNTIADRTPWRSQTRFFLAFNLFYFVHFLHHSDQILDPEIPHALRLQAVLASGVCTVFDKQSQYLLDDIQLTLSNVKAASTSLAEARNDPILARPADINMMEEVSINADAFAPAAFPTGFTPHPAGGRSNRLQDQNDDLILMPSIPDSVDDRAKSGQSPRGLIQAADPEYFVM